MTPPDDASPDAPLSGKRARTQRAILDAAVAIIAETGRPTLTIPAVAKRAGTSHGTVYNYFDNVDDLLASVADVLADVFEFGAVNLAKLTDDPRARVAYGIAQVLNLVTVDRAYATAMSTMVSADPVFRRRIREVVGLQVTRGVEVGVFTTSSEEVTTDALLGAVLQVLRSMLLGEVHDALGPTIEACLRILGADVADAEALVARALEVHTG